jgi:Tfp pilus assembly protein PilN
MASFGSPKNLGKKDMNFFAAFTESARKQARMLLYVILLGLLIFGVFFVWLVIDLIKNGVVKTEIKKLNEELASPEYANLEIEYKNLQQTVSRRNQYFYALTEMRREVDETSVASTEVAILLGESIPNDTYIDTYSITGNQMVITGSAFNYYSYLELVNMLNDSDVFVTPLQCNENRHEYPGDDTLNEEEGSVNAIDAYYDFTITGNLTAETYIAVSRFETDDLGANIPLGGVETVKYQTGDPYEVSGINTYEVNGVTYYLSYIVVNETRMDDEQFAAVSANNAISGIAYENTDIRLYYTATAVTEEGAEGEEGGEAA